jgi:hypothetical protein
MKHCCCVDDRDTAWAYKGDVFRTSERTTVIVLPDIDWLLWSLYGSKIISLVIYLSDQTRVQFCVVVLVRSTVCSSWMAAPCDLNSTRLAHCEFWFWNVFNVSIHVHRRTRFRFKVGQCSGMWLQNTRWALYRQLQCFKWTDAFCFSKLCPDVLCPSVQSW